MPSPSGIKIPDTSPKGGGKGENKNGLLHHATGHLFLVIADVAIWDAPATPAANFEKNLLGAQRLPPLKVPFPPGDGG